MSIETPVEPGHAGLDTHILNEGGFHLIHGAAAEAALDEQAAAYGELTSMTRSLVDLAIRTKVGGPDLDDALAHLEAARLLLAGDVHPGSPGVHYSESGRSWIWGNAVIGLRNPTAPELAFTIADGVGRASGPMTSVHEGQPGLVHGGIVALVLDQLMGATVCWGGRLAMTGTLTMRYVGPLPLGDVTFEAEVTEDHGHKIEATGTATGSNGIAVEAQGTFVVPRWARPA